MNTYCIVGPSKNIQHRQTSRCLFKSLHGCIPIGPNQYVYITIQYYTYLYEIILAICFSCTCVHATDGYHDVLHKLTTIARKYCGLPPLLPPQHSVPPRLTATLESPSGWRRWNALPFSKVSSNEMALKWRVRRFDTSTQLTSPKASPLNTGCNPFLLGIHLRLSEHTPEGLKRGGNTGAGKPESESLFFKFKRSDSSEVCGFDSGIKSWAETKYSASAQVQMA